MRLHICAFQVKPMLGFRHTAPHACRAAGHKSSPGKGKRVLTITRSNRMSRSRFLFPRHPLTCAVLSGLFLASASTGALAQDSKSAATNLDRVTVTGSLIPQTQIENQTPVLTISAEAIQARGFSSVAEVLQQSSLTTGGLQGGQTSASFTQGAEAAGMFGLNPGYTKYLINGRPMLSYPALYNGSDAFNNISGIPIDIVDRIEVLPGGQSSLSAWTAAR
ncbi:hypothetical protein G6F57_016586 [Rhizopus arrhizus]|nr:hypothetical protein G6F57_016586 [Rhizopus arrhizus]